MAGSRACRSRVTTGPAGEEDRWMATGRAPNDATTGATGRQGAATPLRLTTTLYDLMMAVGCGGCGG